MGISSNDRLLGYRINATMSLWGEVKSTSKSVLPLLASDMFHPDGTSRRTTNVELTYVLNVTFLTLEKEGDALTVALGLAVDAC